MFDCLAYYLFFHSPKFDVLLLDFQQENKISKCPTQLVDKNKKISRRLVLESAR
jgi:hypothetical protein